jgi:hypothetical protein
MTKHQSEPNAQPASEPPAICPWCKRPFATVDDVRGLTMHGKCFTRYAYRDPDAANDCELAAANPPPASEPSGREPAMPAGFREWLARAVDVAVSPKQAETVWHGFWRWEPGVPERECTTADMLRRLAMHLSSGALKFTEHDFDTGNWIAALNHRADLLEGRHPAAPAGELEDKYLADINRICNVADKHGWNGIENSKAVWDFFDGQLSERAALEASHAALQAELEAVRLRLLSAAGDDLCRLSQEEIKELSSGRVQIPPKEEFLASCERFHEQIASGPGVLSNCLTLAQLIAENAALQAKLDAVEAERDRLRKFVMPGDGTLIPTGRWTYVAANTKPRIVTDGLCILSVEGVLYVNIDELESALAGGGK